MQVSIDPENRRGAATDVDEFLQRNRRDRGDAAFRREIIRLLESGATVNVGSSRAVLTRLSRRRAFVLLPVPEEVRG